MQKICSVQFGGTVNFIVQRPDWLLNQKTFNQLYFLKICTKMQRIAVSSTCFGEMVDSKILESE